MEYVESVMIDYSMRYPSDWAKIYNVKLVNDDDFEKWDEYKWAWNLVNRIKYEPVYKIINGEMNFDKFEEMQIRAETLCRDVYIHASEKEKKFFDKNKRYIDTDWVRKQMRLL